MSVPASIAIPQIFADPGPQLNEHGARVVPGWNDYFLTIAEAVGARSKDPSTQIGAVIVDDENQIVSTGYNGLPRGMVEDDPILFERPSKYDYFEHAERNAIYAAARKGCSVKGCRIYLAGKHFCCLECARAIVQAGISEVFCPEPDFSNPTFKFDVALAILTECGVKVTYTRDNRPILS